MKKLDAQYLEFLDKIAAANTAAEVMQIAEKLAGVFMFNVTARREWGLFGIKDIFYATNNRLIEIEFQSNLEKYKRSTKPIWIVEGEGVV